MFHTGENVLEFFFRVVSLTFDNAVLRETESSGPQQQIGSNLISEIFIYTLLHMHAY